MAKPKPYIAAACFCEVLIEGKDKALSVIRIVDTYTVPELSTDQLPSDAVPAIRITGLIALKSGDVTGSHNIRLVLENPLKERKDVSPPGGWPVVLSGGAGGVNLVLRFPLGVKNFGQCWFDVLFDDELLSRMPLTLLRAQEQKDADSQS